MKGKKKGMSRVEEDALIGGLMGLFFGHLLGTKNEDKAFSALLGAAVGAAVGAMQEAQENGVDVYAEEDGWLVKISPDGQRTRIKELQTKRRKINHRNYNLRYGR
jgi:Glycine zipper 2TM domain